MQERARELAAELRSLMAMQHADCEATYAGYEGRLSRCKAEWAALGEAADLIEALLPDAERLDALEAMVQQSAERGECVLIDARGGHMLIEYWDDCSVFELATVSDGLCEAIDTAMEAHDEHVDKG